MTYLVILVINVNDVINAIYVILILRLKKP